MLHWIRTAAQSGFGPLVLFAYGLRKDLKAVIAAVETSWSNGQTEGQINRLNASKRSSAKCTGALGSLFCVRESYLIRPWLLEAAPKVRNPFSFGSDMRSLFLSAQNDDFRE
jgi:hypothetical protein